MKLPSGRWLTWVIITSPTWFSSLSKWTQGIFSSHLGSFDMPTIHVLNQSHSSCSGILCHWMWHGWMLQNLQSTCHFFSTWSWMSSWFWSLAHIHSHVSRLVHGVLPPYWISKYLINYCKSYLVQFEQTRVFSIAVYDHNKAATGQLENHAVVIPFGISPTGCWVQLESQ